VNVSSLIAMAMQHHRSGRLFEAEMLYRQVLARDPRQPDALHLLGVLAYQGGHLEAAEDLIRQAIAINGSNPDFPNNLGLVYQARGQSYEAIAWYQRALRLRPRFAEALNNLGGAFKRLDRWDEAEAAYRESLRINPRQLEAQVNLGDVLARRRQFEEAVACYRKALQINARSGEAHFRLGQVLGELDRLEEALTCYEAAVQLTPSNVEIYGHLTGTLVRLGRTEEAIARCRSAIATHPNSADLYLYLARALKGRQENLDEAIRCCQRALTLDPENDEARHVMSYLCLHQGNVEDAIAYCEQTLSRRPDYETAYSVLFFGLLRQASSTPQEILEAHRRFASAIEAPLVSSQRPHANNRDPERRLKIGYVSSDFRVHSVAWFMEPILANHDRAQVETYGYYSHADVDPVTERFRRYFDHWLPCKALSDDQLADRIRADRIDILVDLAGHTSGNRLCVFARRPAPVQVTYLGYPTTTGLSAMDYRFTTWDVDPEGGDAWFTERLYRLPRTLWCYRSPFAPPGSVSPPPAMLRGEVSFGSMNHPSKISAETVALWAALLHSVPRSRLVMSAIPEGGARRLLYERFAARSIGPERLVLHPRLPVDQFRALSDQIDIALDPFPYNGTTTTCEALAMGIPVVTLIGKTSVSRCGYALLKSVGLLELCAEDESEYVRIAAALAGDLPRLDALRQGMPQRLDGSPLRDEAGMARDIERAYRTMWREWCAAWRA
jgi:protein O-GlcNAc transferase